MKQYELIVDYKENKHFNNDLNNMIKKAHNATFEDWMIRGHNFESYIPVALLNEKNEIVASTGIVKTKLYINGVACSAIQIANIFIKDGHQKENLESKLLTELLKKYSNIMDIIYTFSDEIQDVLFLENGFTLKEEYLYYIPWEKEKVSAGSTIKKLEVDNPKDLEILSENLKHGTKNLSLIFTQGNSELKMYNILANYRWNIHYIVEMDVVAIFTIKNSVFRLIDVYSKTNINLIQLLEIIVPKGIGRVEFGFVPNIKSGLHVTPMKNVERTNLTIKSHLYIKELTVNLNDIKLMFPVLGRVK